MRTYQILLASALAVAVFAEDYEYEYDDLGNKKKKKKKTPQKAVMACPANETYNECGNSCNENRCCGYNFACDMYETACGTACEPRCECDTGYYRDTNGSCVELTSCSSNVQCPTNEVWNSCGSACSETACTQNPGKKICSSVCEPRCECATGYIRDTISGFCVSDGQCSQVIVCPANEEYKFCGNSCLEATCDDSDISDNVCSSVCEPRCECSSGYVRDSTGACIAAASCPVTVTCGANETYTECGNSCAEASCAEQGVITKSCTTACEARCECNSGYYRETDGTCVLQSECASTTPTCGDNEEYNYCGSSCSEPSCDNPTGTGKVCTEACEARCECKAGFVRNAAWQCVAQSSCMTCGDNEVYNACGSSCQENANKCPEAARGGKKNKKKSKGKEEETVVCAAVCEEMCECASGYRRQNGVCVLECDSAPTIAPVTTDPTTPTTGTTPEANFVWPPVGDPYCEFLDDLNAAFPNLSFTCTEKVSKKKETMQCYDNNGNVKSTKTAKLKKLKTWALESCGEVPDGSICNCAPQFAAFTTAKCLGNNTWECMSGNKTKTIKVKKAKKCTKYARKSKCY